MPLFWSCLVTQRRIGRGYLAEGIYGRGLFAEADMEPGTVVLDVPLDLCIIQQLDASEANMQIQGEMTDAERSLSPSLPPSLPPPLSLSLSSSLSLSLSI